MRIIEIPCSEGAPRVLATPNGTVSVAGMTDAKFKGWRCKKQHSAVRFFGHCAINVRHADGKVSKRYVAAELTKKNKVTVPIRMQWCNTRREAYEKALLWLCAELGLAIETSDTPGNLIPARRSALLAQFDGHIHRASWSIHVVVRSAEQPDARSGGNCLPIHVVEPAGQPAETPLDSSAPVEAVRVGIMAEPGTNALGSDGSVKGTGLDPHQSRGKALFSRLIHAVQRLARATWKVGGRLLRPGSHHAR